MNKIVLYLAISIHAATAQIVTEGIAFPLEDVEVSSSTEGVVQSFLPTEGSYVNKGDVILRYKHTKEDIQVKQAKLNFEKSRVDLKNAESLEAKGIYTIDKVSDLRYTHSKSKIELEMAELLREEKDLKSPISGFLVKKNIDTGELSNRSNPVCRIINKESLIIELFIEKSLFSHVKLGEVYKTVFPELSDKTTTSKVVFVDAVIDAKSGFLRVKTVVDNTGGNIQPGLKAKVFLEPKK